MPDCYHVTSSPPNQTAKDVRECVREVGGPGRVRHLKTDGRRVFSFVAYRDRSDAERHLGAITQCLELKGHTVHEALVLEDFAELANGDEAYGGEGGADASV